MLHPLLDSISSLTDSEVELKISQLSRKFWQTKNPQVQEQISSILEIYKEEAIARRAKSSIQKNEKDGENGLDNLINIS